MPALRNDSSSHSMSVGASREAQIRLQLTNLVEKGVLVSTDDYTSMASFDSLNEEIVKCLDDASGRRRIVPLTSAAEVVTQAAEKARANGWEEARMRLEAALQEQ